MPPKKSKAQKKGEEIDEYGKDMAAAAAARLEARVMVPGEDELRAEIKRAVGRSVQDYPRGENSAFRALIPKRDEQDVFWTDDNEEEITALVDDEGSLPNELCKCPPVIDAVWRTCFRFLGCLASDVVGYKNRLVYGSNQHRSKNAHWSEGFCKGLQYVMLHPHFRRSTAEMGLALQWASICRTDDRRTHVLNGCNSNVFLMALQDVINSTPAEVPAVQLEVARLLYKDSFPGEDEPAWFQLLMGIDAASKRVQNKFRKLPEDMSKLYMVTSEDVAAVLSGLDNIRYLSFRMYLGHQTYHDTIAFTRCSDDRPSKEDVEKAIRQVVLSDLRNQRRQELLGNPIPGSPQRPL